MKVVINKCYGGFGLSKEACQRYWELQGKEVWIEDNDWGFNVWLVPPEERVVQGNWKTMTQDERIAYNRKRSEQTWDSDGVDRHDPILVQVVEELGDKANGMCAELAIAEVCADCYRIDEYDGFESVETPESYDWITP